MKPEETQEKHNKQDFLKKKKSVEEFQIKKEKKTGNNKLASILSLLLIILSISLPVLYYFIIYKSLQNKVQYTNIAQATPNSYNFNNIEYKNINPNFLISKKYDLSNFAKSIGIYDLNSGKSIFEKNADQKLPIASLTKILTVSTMESLYTSSQEFVMDPIAGNISGSRANINVGDKLQFNQVLYGMMLPSGNDVALNVAMQYGYNDFIKNMNNISQSIGNTNTNITNPVGFDDTNHYSTVKDLFNLSKLYLEREINRQVAQTQEYSIITDTNTYKLTNTNDLLIPSNPDILGLKTGTTDAAGECLDLYIKENGREYIAIILNSSNRDMDGFNILKWLRANG